MKVRASLLVALAACGRSATTPPPPPPPHDAAPVRIPDAEVRIPDAAPLPVDAAVTTGDIVIPGGEHGIGFDDLQYSGDWGVIVPAGQTGQIVTYDESDQSVHTVAGFGKDATYHGGHDEGVTSVVWAWNVRFLVLDRDAKQLLVTDAAGAVQGKAKLAADPDYVRAIGPREIWVTEPAAEQIEVFLENGKLVETIKVPAGPESLTYSPILKQAYTNLWNGKTVAIDLTPGARKIVATWDNGCQGSRGLVINPGHDWLFVGCAEGKVTALDAEHDGKLLGSADTGAGVDIIAYAPRLHHLYVPGGKAATTTVVEVGDDGSLEAVGTVPAAKGAHCAVTDNAGRVWVCDPAHGKLLGFTDGF